MRCICGRKCDRSWEALEGECLMMYAYTVCGKLDSPFSNYTVYNAPILIIHNKNNLKSVFLNNWRLANNGEKCFFLSFLSGPLKSIKHGRFDSFWKLWIFHLRNAFIFFFLLFQHQIWFLCFKLIDSRREFILNFQEHRLRIFISFD